MPRAKSPEALRERTRKSLINAIKKQGFSEQFINDKIDEYMTFYDGLNCLNIALNTIKNNPNGLDLKAFTEATKEARQISNAMRSILLFLRVDPAGLERTQDGDADAQL